jgi:hypothetical protein
LTIGARRLLIAQFLLASLLATAGCGGNASKPGSGPPLKLDACELFTDQDARTIAGDTLAAMTSTLDDARGRNPLECIYNSGNLEQPRILSLLIRQHASAAAAKELQESSRSALGAMSGGKLADVPGVGDGAIWVGGRIQQLHVLAGSRQLVITVQSPDGTDQLPRARQIATLVLARLQAAAAKKPGKP